MKPHITQLKISGFRVLRRFFAEGLGRVNLITGRNNTGKSSILEALRILTSDASPSVVFSILRYREENVGEREEVARMDETEALFQFSSLFSGFPQLGDEFQPIQIQAKGGQRDLELSLRIGYLSQERSPGGGRRVTEPQRSLLFPELEEEGLPALMIESPNGTRNVPLDYFRRYPYRSRLYRSEFGEEPRLQCVYVSPYGGERTANLGALWDNIALSDSEKDIVRALQIIDPEISAVSMVGGESPRQSRTAIVRSDNFQRPVPLRSFGDGLNRLFGIVLSLVNAKGGILLIDEFENGMHHTVQFDAWRAIFRLAQDLDVQVFATSHSWDAIEAFQKATAETPGDGVLMRLSHMGDDVIPTLFRENELAVATRDGIEVR